MNYYVTAMCHFECHSLVSVSQIWQLYRHITLSLYSATYAVVSPYHFVPVLCDVCRGDFVPQVESTCFSTPSSQPLLAERLAREGCEAQRVLVDDLVAVGPEHRR